MRSNEPVDQFINGELLQRQSVGDKLGGIFCKCLSTIFNIYSGIIHPFKNGSLISEYLFILVQECIYFSTLNISINSNVDNERCIVTHSNPISAIFLCTATFTSSQHFRAFNLHEVFVIPEPDSCVGLQTLNSSLATANQTNTTSAAIEFWE